MLIPFVDTTVYSAGGGAGVITLEESNKQNTANQTAYTETVAIGTASSDRLVVVALSGREANVGDAMSVVSVTIGGVSATVVSDAVAAANDAIIGIAYAVVPTGTTAALVVTFSDAAAELKWSTYTIRGLASSTAHDSVTGSGTAVSGAVSLNIPADGVQVCAATWAVSLVGDNLTFSGVTEDWSFGSNNTQFGHGSDDAMTVESARTLTVTGPASANYKIAAVSWS